MRVNWVLGVVDVVTCAVPILFLDRLLGLSSVVVEGIERVEEEGFFLVALSSKKLPAVALSLHSVCNVLEVNTLCSLLSMVVLCSC